MSECVYKMKRGWYCRRLKFHTGPCALEPKWWNLPGRLMRSEVAWFRRGEVTYMECLCGNTAPVGTSGWKVTDAPWCPKCAWLA